MKNYGEDFLIENTNAAYHIYKKQPKELICIITKQNNNLLQISDSNGNVYLENLLYIKCITDFDTFDYEPYSRIVYNDYIPTEQLACFDGNDFLYVDLKTFESSIRYEMVTQEVFLLDGCRINRKKIFEMLSRYRKEGKYREVQQFIEDFWDKNSRFVACSPDIRSEWGAFLGNCFELEARYSEYEVPELHSFHGYALLKKNGKYGLVNLGNYQMTIPCEYDAIKWTHYSWGISWVKRFNKWGILNWNSGEIVLPVNYDEVIHDYDISKVKRNGKWGLVSGRTGQIILQENDKDDTDEIVHGLKKIYCTDKYPIKCPFIAKSTDQGKWEILGSSTGEMGSSIWKEIKIKGLKTTDLDEVIPFNSTKGISYVGVLKNNRWGLLKLEDSGNYRPTIRLIEEILSDDLNTLKEKYGINEVL